jgi:hypothetical protein
VVLKVRDWLGWGGGGGWIHQRCLKVPPLQGWVDLKGGVEYVVYYETMKRKLI